MSPSPRGWSAFATAKKEFLSPPSKGCTMADGEQRFLLISVQSHIDHLLWAAHCVKRSTYIISLNHQFCEAGIILPTFYRWERRRCEVKLLAWAVVWTQGAGVHISPAKYIPGAALGWERWGECLRPRTPKYVSWFSYKGMGSPWDGMELGVSHLTSLFFLLLTWKIIITNVIIKSLKPQCGNVLDMTWGSGEQRESGLCHRKTVSRRQGEKTGGGPRGFQSTRLWNRIVNTWLVGLLWA